MALCIERIIALGGLADLFRIQIPVLVMHHIALCRHHFPAAEIGGEAVWPAWQHLFPTRARYLEAEPAVGGVDQLPAGGWRCGRLFGAGFGVAFAYFDEAPRAD